jgi:uncharacterized protein (DUF58 family)
MSIPSVRLLWLLAAGVFPFSVLCALLGWPWFFIVLAVLCIAIVALLDLLLSQQLLAEVKVSATSPQRCFVHREHSLALALFNRQALTLHVGLAWPDTWEAEREIQSLTLPAQQLMSVVFAATPKQRGIFPLSTLHLETGSRLGCWQMRHATALDCELRVYPTLPAAELAALLRGDNGARVQRQLGQGREFEKLREYQAGDSMQQIHWKATARRSQPITRVYQIERTQEIYLCLDASRLSSRQSGRDSILDHYLNASLALGRLAEKNGDLFGLVAFSDRVHHFLRAQKGKAHFAACREALFALQPDHAPADFDELFSALHLSLRRRSLIIVLTSLEDPVLAEAFARASQLVSRRHLVVAAMLQPPGLQPLFSEPVTANHEVYERLSGSIAWRQLRLLALSLRRQGVRFRLMEQGRVLPELAAVYDEVRQQQLL